MEIEIPPGANELIEINNVIQQEVNRCNTEFIFNIIPDTVSMRSVLTTSNPILFISELNTLLGFTKTDYSAGAHISEKPVMITTTDKVHLKCDCVDGPLVNGNENKFYFQLILVLLLDIKLEKNPILF